MKSAEQNIISFLKENPSVWSAAALQRMEFRNRKGTLASPKAISRRLQENAEAGGCLTVSYDDHNNAMYSIKSEFKKKPILVVDEDAPPIRIDGGAWRPQFKYV